MSGNQVPKAVEITDEAMAVGAEVRWQAAWQWGEEWQEEEWQRGSRVCQGVGVRAGIRLCELLWTLQGRLGVH
jgi:hypothetical protein